MKISVCLATYNGEAYLSQQLTSILNQLGKEDEVIISDDSSSDNTLKIIKDTNDSRIKLFKDQKFQSPIRNFENALSQSSGEIIFLADQDDIWESNKIEIILKSLKDCDIVVSDCFIIDSDDNIINKSFFEVNGSRPGLIKNIIKNSYLGCTLGFRRKVLKKAMPFPPQIPMHDWWLGLVGEVFYKTKFINQKLVRYRRHDHNASSTSGKSKNTLFIKLLFRIKLIWEILKLCWRK